MSPATIFQIHLVLGYVPWLLCFGAYVWPRLKAMDRVEAQRAIATLHSFRFFGLVFIIPGVVGPNLPTGFAVFAAYGDFATGLLAMLALLTVRIRSVFWPFVVAFNLVGTADIIIDYYHGTQVGLPTLAGELGATYAIPIVYVPALMITHVVAFYLLARRQTEAARTYSPAVRLLWRAGPMRTDDRTHAWIVVVLLFIFVVINFADKAVIGIAAVPIMQELKLGPRQFGLLGSSFFLLFAVSSVATGFLVNRVQARWVLLAMGFIWALTQFPMIGSVGFATLVACRIALGAGEGPATPVALHAAYKWFPNELRTLPTAVIVQGGAIGVMVALPLLNSVIVRWTWHWAFGSLGLVGLLWCALWLIFGREGSLDSESVKAKDAAPSLLRVGYAQLLLSPTILACWAAAFGANWALSLALSWQGAYLIKGLGLAQSSIGFLGALPAGGSAVAMLATGWYSQRLLSRGVSSRVARGILGGLSVVLGGAALALLPYVPGTTVKIALTTLGVALPSVIYVISNAVVGEITPAAQRGAVLAIGTAVGSSAGLFAPYIMGRVIETATTPLDGFNTGFFMCGVIMLVGGAIAMALVDPELEAKRQSRRLLSLTAST